MKKNYYVWILSILFIINGIITISAEDQENNYMIQEKISFSKPQLTNLNDGFAFTFPETNAVLIKPGFPQIPYYKKQYVFPFGTIIENIEIKMNNELKVQALPNNIAISPQLYPPGFTFSQYDNQNMNDVSNERSLYPTIWYESSVNCGLYEGDTSLILTIHYYPIRFFNDFILYIDAFDTIITYKESDISICNNEQDTLLIITPNEFTDILQPYINHKETKGFEIYAIDLESIYDGSYFPTQGRDDAEKVKYFIKNAYEAWGIDYVLLVGGRKPGITESWYIPVRYIHVFWADENRYISDLYFADIYTGDYTFSSWDTDNNDIFSQWSEFGMLEDELDLYPEVFIGRWPCRNAFELKLIIQKTISYENMQLAKKIVLVGGDNFEEPGIEGEIVCDKSLDYLTEFSSEKVYATEMDVNPENIRNALGDGAIFLHMHGHGNPIKWGTHPPEVFDEWEEGLYITDVPWFSNTEYPILLLGGCHTAMFNVSNFNRPWTYTWRLIPEGLGWWFARKIDGGGIATLGYTCFPVASPGEYGDLNNDGVNEPDCMESGYGFIQLQLLKGYGIEGLETLGSCWNYAVTTYLDTFKIPFERWHLHTSQGFVLMGDPTLQIGG